MKQSLQKALLKQKEQFKEAQKQAQLLRREVERQEMKESGNDASKNIILPKYVLNKDLKVYEEVDVPPKSLYKPIGFNDLNRVKIFMEGDDNDKRTEFGSKIASVSIVKRQSTRFVNNKQLNSDMAEMVELNRQTEVTNLHYRKYYEDELENDRTLFPDPDDPFIKIPVKRGQSRGLQKSWFSFFSEDKVDESGEITNEKVVGYFKGRVKITN